jgi:tetratricopeptide (TPR) repeat protein
VNRRAALGIAIGASMIAGCVVPPQDPLAAGEHALRRQDLARALIAFDAVPVTHPRYPDARLQASAIEQRMRRSQELLLAALERRAQWRDEEALVLLREAHELWPNQTALFHLARVTERRLELAASAGALPTPTMGVAAAPHEVPAAAAAPVGPVARTPLERGPVGRPVDRGPVDRPVEREPAERGSVEREPAERGPVERGPVEREPVALPPAAADAEPPPPIAAPDTAIPLPAPTAVPAIAGDEPLTPVAPGPEATVRAQPTPLVEPAPARVADDVVAAALIAVEQRLAAGDRGAAMAELHELHLRHGADARIRWRLTRLLHQRALAFYGEGALTAAMDDWARALALEPDNAVMRACWSRAQTERAARSPLRGPR